MFKSQTCFLLFVSVMFREMGLWKQQQKRRLTALHQRTVQILCFSSLGNKQIRKIGSRLRPAAHSEIQTYCIPGRKSTCVETLLILHLFPFMYHLLFFYGQLPHSQIYSTTMFPDISQIDICLC